MLLDCKSDKEKGIDLLQLLYSVMITLSRQIHFSFLYGTQSYKIQFNSLSNSVQHRLDKLCKPTDLVNTEPIQILLNQYK